MFSELNRDLSAGAAPRGNRRWERADAGHRAGAAGEPARDDRSVRQPVARSARHGRRRHRSRDLHADWARGPARSVHRPGRHQQDERHHAGARRCGVEDQPLPADAVPRECHLWRADRGRPVLHRRAECVVVGRPRDAAALRSLPGTADRDGLAAAAGVRRRPRAGACC